LALKLPLQAAATRLWVLVPLAIVLGLGPSRRALAEMAPQCQPAQSLRLSAEPPPPGTDAPPRGIQSELRLAAVAGTYLRFVITSGYDLLVVRQLRLDGSLVERVELQADADEPSHLSWIVTTPGVYVFAVAPAAPASPAAGAYAIALEEERPVGACDEARLRVERAVAAAFRLLQPGAKAAPAAVREEIARTAADADAVGELATKVVAQLDAGRAEKILKEAGAADLFQSTLALAVEIGDFRSEAVALENLADPSSAGDADAERALEITRGHGFESLQASLRMWQSDRRDSNGDLAGAAEELRQALASQWRTGDLNDQSWTLSRLGSLQRRLGDSARSRSYLDVAFERAEAAADRAGQADVLVESALLAIDLGELQAASDDLKSAHCLLASAATREEAETAARVLERQALLDLYLGETDKARGEFTDAIAAFEALRLPADLAEAHLGLGAAWQAANQRGSALANFQQAFDLIEANSITGDARAQALYLLGKANLEEQTSKAIAELQEALRLLGAAASVRHAQVGLELARAYSQAGHAEAAETAFREAIDLAAEAHAPVVEAAAQAGLARAELARGELAVARTAIERAIRLTEDLRAAVIDADQRVSFLASRRGYFEVDVDVLMRLDQLEPGAGHDREAFAASERARARGLLDLLAIQEVKVGEIVPADLKLRQQEIDDRIAVLQTRLLSSASLIRKSGQDPKEALADLERALAGAEEDETNLAVEADRRRPGYLEVRAPRPQALIEVQRLLDAKTAFLEYFVGKEASYLFVVTQDGLYAHKLPAPKERLARLAGDLAAAVRQESRLHARDFADAAYDLYSVAVLPAAAELAGTPRWIVAPDGPLYTVSFDALLTEPARGATAPRPYLIRRHTVSYAPSASVLAQLLGGRRRAASAPSEAKLFVGFGDPTPPLAADGADNGGEGCPGPAQDHIGALGAGGDLRGAPASAASGGGHVGGAVPARLAALPAAREEVCGISRLFPAGTTAVFLGAGASEENVKRSALVASARNLHFATHGLLDEVHPNRSGLQLAHAAGSREDGLLQVREVFNLELQADLVVLSACSSGQGKEVSGEGLIGMTRAFLYAGAASVVATLWAVDDSSTSSLMVEFYRQLLATGDKADALRQAKLALLDSPQYSHPHYWAPFVLIGRQL
jgi:CHAT domain-containing protein